MRKRSRLGVSQLQPDPGKPHVIVATLGHVDHGKTTLTAAITKVLALQGLGRFIPYDEIDNAPQETLGEQTFYISRVEYQTAQRLYTIVDCPGPADYQAALGTGAVKLDGAILVISAADGPMPQTGDHVRLIRQLGLRDIVVFLNKTEMLDSPELLVEAVRQVRDLLETNGLIAVTVPVVKGSALKALESNSTDPNAPEYAPILQLLHALDSVII